MTDNRPQQRIVPIAFTPTVAALRPKGWRVKPWQVVVTGVLAAALVIAGFLVMARSLVVVTQPLGAEVDLSGGFSFRIGDNFLLMPGDYQVSATHPLYHTLQQSLSVTDQDLQNLTLTLTPLPGRLQVTTEPETRVQVYIDGELIGENHAIFEQVSAGEHEYLITSDRYQDVQGTINLIGKRELAVLHLPLTPAWADVRLNTEPAGADIMVEGDIVGSSPATIELLAGDREIEISKAGYKTFIYPISVEPLTEIDLGTITLSEIDGLINVLSKPSGAGVTINGQYVGQTPVEVPVSPSDKLTLAFFKEGYQAAQKTVAIGSGNEQQVSVTLVPQLGDVAVKAKPADALLYVDGRLSGRADQILTLPTLQHQITITREGYADYSTTIIPRPGKAQYLNPVLKTLEQAKWEKVKPIITTATGQTLKLFRPSGEFEMGSSRREQGRRANEALRKVELTRAFYLATHETTNGQFRRFINSHSSSHVSGNSLDNNQNPVVNVSWLEAALFCNWLSDQEGLEPFYQIQDGELTGFNAQAIGYRLPTEAEWAWAARVKGSTLLKYSWGPALPPPEKATNIGDRSAAALLGTIQASYDDGFAVTAPVGSFSANHNGLFDLNGNASEWVNDFYHIKTGLSLKTEIDPLGPTEGDYHVIRGASWANGSISDLRLSFRDYGNDRKNTVGFRIARFVE